VSPLQTIQWFPTRRLLPRSRRRRPFRQTPLPRRQPFRRIPVSAAGFLLSPRTRPAPYRRHPKIRASEARPKPSGALAHTSHVPSTTSARRQLIEIDGKRFLFQHGYRFGKVTYVTRLPLGKSMTVFTPGHLSASEVEAVVRGDNPWMLE